jgi:exonuclease VII large subunit
VAELEKHYQTRKLQERPTSRLAQARQRLQAAVKRLNSRKSLCKEAQCRSDKTTAKLCQQQTQLTDLCQRLLRFEQENAANSEPVAAEFRLDAGFGTYENVALLIEMGYEVYTNPHSHKIVTYRVWAGRRHHSLGTSGCQRRAGCLARCATQALSLPA